MYKGMFQTDIILTAGTYSVKGPNYQGENASTTNRTLFNFFKLVKNRLQRMFIKSNLNLCHTGHSFKLILINTGHRVLTKTQKYAGI